MRVIKISGHDLDRPDFVARFAADVARIAREERGELVLINGGGKSIKALQTAFDITEKKVAGLRVTDEKSLEITEMVMSAQVNKLLVRALQQAGLDAIGLSGVDARLLTARKKILTGPESADLGFVGEIIAVRTDLLHQLLEIGLTPVLSPVSCDAAGQHYNINADEAATAVAQALAADQLDFVSNVPGVLRDLSDSRVIPSIDAAGVEALLADGTISGGMVPKVRAALAAVAAGVKQARIVDLTGLADGGTIFINAISP